MNDVAQTIEMIAGIVVVVVAVVSLVPTRRSLLVKLLAGILGLVWAAGMEWVYLMSLS